MVNGNYDNVVLFYFSGTGNAKHVSAWIVEQATRRGSNALIYNIEEELDLASLHVEGKTLLGFCSPTHGFNFPPVMLHFIHSFRWHSTADVFIVNTRGGLKLFKWFTPGINGIAQIYPALVFMFKNFRIVGMQPMDMPSNWISLHPGVRYKTMLSIFRRCYKISKKFTDKLLDGKCVYKALWSLPLDLLIAPISILYYFVGRFALAKTFAANSNCNLCGVCMEQCPVKAIKKRNNRMYWTFRCESCMRCMNKCSKRAIETVHGYTAIIWTIIFIIIPVIINKLLFDTSIIPVEINSFYGEAIEFVLLLGCSLIIIFIAYIILHLLLKINSINKIIAFGSFTHYKFWRRYKQIKTKDLQKIQKINNQIVI